MTAEVDTEHTASEAAGAKTVSDDYSMVTTTGRIALYDNLMSAPRITEIPPAPTADFIENIASTVYDQASRVGGTIPYTVIREVSENFIHAQFSEVIVSILDRGATIRFADQGPGIKQKDKAQMPGFSSAKEPMKRYIRGVGSGLPIVCEYLNFSHGRITIEDNLNCGSVITITTLPEETLSQVPTSTLPTYSQPRQEPAHANKLPQSLIPPLNAREKTFLSCLYHEGELGVTDLTKMTNTAASSVYTTLTKLEEAGLVQKIPGQKKRMLTDLGIQVASSLS